MTWPRTQRPVDVHLTLTTVPMAKRYSPEYWPAMGGARPAVGLPAVPFSASVSGRSGAAAAFFFAAGAFFFAAAAVRLRLGCSSSEEASSEDSSSESLDAPASASSSESAFFAFFFFFGAAAARLRRGLADSSDDEMDASSSESQAARFFADDVFVPIFAYVSAGGALRARFGRPPGASRAGSGAGGADAAARLTCFTGDGGWSMALRTAATVMNVSSPSDHATRTFFSAGKISATRPSKTPLP